MFGSKRVAEIQLFWADAKVQKEMFTVVIKDLDGVLGPSGGSLDDREARGVVADDIGSVHQRRA